MGFIKYNNGMDFIIESENTKIYKIDDKQLVNFEENLNYNLDDKYIGEDIFNNTFIEWITYFYNNDETFIYKDKSFGDEIINFKYATFIGDKYYTINSKLLEDMYNDKQFENYDIDIYLVDTNKNLYFNIGKVNFKLSPSISGFLSGSPSSLTIKGDIYFNRFRFVEFIFNNYLAMSYGDGEFEGFKWED